MSTLSRFLKPIMPVLAAVYGFMLIYVTAMPMAGGNESLSSHVLTWMLTLAAIALTFVLVRRVEPRVFPEAKKKWGRFCFSADFLLFKGLRLLGECQSCMFC